MGWVTPKKLVFLGVLGLKKTISSCSFDRIVLIFGYIVEHSNTEILSSHFFAISVLNPNYDIINAKVVVERCGFHHWKARCSLVICDIIVTVAYYFTAFITVQNVQRLLLLTSVGEHNALHCSAHFPVSLNNISCQWHIWYDICNYSIHF